QIKQLQIARNGYIFVSTLFYLAAAVYLFNPSPPKTIECYFAGVFLLIYGAIKIMGFCSNDLYCLAFQYDLAVGLLMLVIGAILLAKAPQCAPYLSVGFGWIALLDGLLKLQMSKDAKRFGLEQWKSILTLSIITGVASVLLICMSANPVAVHTLTVCVLLAEGILNHYVVVLTVRPRHSSK
ncbi:MAG: DUF308 domain-containing protein, partial [Oscillospiraceae bacterium]|nr:DUF308 domain-containing protein [Oscillospiraceae bacterium]